MREYLIYAQNGARVTYIGRTWGGTATHALATAEAIYGEGLFLTRA